MMRFNGYSDEDVADIIMNVSESGCFGRSLRQKRLFEYLLSKSISGVSSEVTQYSIALDVLERSEDFDPSSDSIVRVEMHRLRANLAIYNSGKFDYYVNIPPAGFKVITKPRNEGVIAKLKAKPFHILSGALVAAMALIIAIVTPHAFTRTTQPPAGAMSCSEIIPNIQIANIGELSEAQRYVENIIRSTIAQQTGFHLLNDNQICSHKAAPIFNIEYTIMQQGERFNLAITTLSHSTRNIVVSNHLSGEIVDAEQDTTLFYKIVETVNEITRPDGIMARMALNEQWASDIGRENYQCVIMMYDSFAGETDIEFQNVLHCLERSMETGSAPLDNIGALAASYLDQARDLEPQFSSEEFESAETLIKKYDNEWINSAEITVTKIYYEVQREDFNPERLDLLLSNAKNRYNSNPSVLLNVATFVGFTLGDWEEAKKISDQVKRIYSIRDQSVFEVDAGYAFMRLQGNELINDCAKFYTKNSIYVNVLLNACARKAQNSEWFNITEENLNRLNAKTVNQRMAVFETTQHDRKLLAEVKNNLELALKF